jgi:hypothetical protein
VSGRQPQPVFVPVPAAAAGIVSCSSLRRGPWRCTSEKDLWDSGIAIATARQRSLKAIDRNLAQLVKPSANVT